MIFRRRQPKKPHRTTVSPAHLKCRPNLEELETRTLLATSILKTNLVADTPGVALVTDPKLINPWGIALNAPIGVFWIADNGTGVSTLYDGAGQPFPSGSPLIVTIPPPAGSPAGTTATPTGTVFNSGSGFVISANGASAPAQFLFAGEDGTISGWNSAVDGTHAVVKVDNSAQRAVYKGLALGTNATGTFLFAANFKSGKIDVFDQQFHGSSVPGGFTDASIPAGFAPFNIKNLNGKLFVTYAKQNAAGDADMPGPGNGFVDVFDTNGTRLQRLASGGSLNSPWGETIAPASFGDFSNDVLVGNFGDGRINAFDPASGALVGQLQDAQGNPITIDGLWALTFGNGTGSADANTLYFTAGTDHEKHGLFAKLQAVTATAGPVFAVGGAPGRVQLRNISDGSLVADFAPYGSSYTGPVSVALGDVNGDGFPDVVTGARTGSPHVKVFDGKAIHNRTFDQANPDASVLASFFAYDLQFHVGVNVAVGKVNGDGFADLVTGASVGNPHVKVYNSAAIAAGTFQNPEANLLASFFAYTLNLNLGANVAVGDVTHSGFADLITGATGGNPHVKVYSGQAVAKHSLTSANPDASLRASFFAFGLNQNTGASVAAGDTTGTGFADIITGAGNGSSEVKVFSGKAIANGTFRNSAPDADRLDQFFATDVQTTGGVQVGAADFDGDGKADILTGFATSAANFRVISSGSATGTKPPALNGIEGTIANLQGPISVGV
jgi:uncharacterized protein (TIGR03118 family)